MFAVRDGRALSGSSSTTSDSADVSVTILQPLMSSLWQAPSHDTPPMRTLTGARQVAGARQDSPRITT